MNYPSTSICLYFFQLLVNPATQDSFTMKKLHANKEMTRKLREMAICGSRLTRNFASSVNGRSFSLPPTTEVLEDLAGFRKNGDLPAAEVKNPKLSDVVIPEE